VYAVIGCSLGGIITTEMLVQKKLNIEKAIIDAAYLTTMCTWMCKISSKIILKLLRGVKKDNKILKYLINKQLSKEALEEVSKVWLNMSDESIENIALSNYSYVVPESIADVTTDIAYWYGQNEKRLLIKSAKRLSRLVPLCQIEEFTGLGHGDLVSKHSDVFTKKTKDFWSKTQHCIS
jgi:DNA polymerase I-like protein with 3'-5' exonuclease and polymerase domains